MLRKAVEEASEQEDSQPEEEPSDREESSSPFPSTESTSGAEKMEADDEFTQVISKKVTRKVKKVANASTPTPTTDHGQWTATTVETTAATETTTAAATSSIAEVTKQQQQPAATATSTTTRRNSYSNDKNKQSPNNYLER